MAQEASGKADTRTFLAGDTFGAYAVVSFMTAGSGQTAPFVRAHITETAYIIGVAQRGASATGEAIQVVLPGPTVKVVANASVSAGAIVGPATDAAGRVIERALPTTNTAIVPVLGLALFSTDTNGTLEVMLHQTLYSELA